LDGNGIGDDDEHDAGAVLEDGAFLGSEFVVRRLGEGGQTHE
jgi:hypothetical protein